MKLIINPKGRIFLELLSELGPLCGQDIARLSNSYISSGVAFSIAADFEAHGLIVSELEKNPVKRIHRRFFKITENGELFLKTLKQIQICERETSNQDSFPEALAY